MNTNQWLYYGLIAGELQIKAFILMVCNVVSPGTVENAKLLLAETIAVESNNGKAKDESFTYGEGLTQFDNPTFEYIKNYFLQDKFQELRSRIKTFLLIDLEKVQYTDLRKSPLLSILMARLLYYKVPEAIPGTDQGRWEYYKKWFNSSLGATTKEKYFSAMNRAVFQEVQNV